MRKIAIILAGMLLLGLCGCHGAGQGSSAQSSVHEEDSAAAEKPVIYIYPDSAEEPTEEPEEEPLDEKPVTYLYPEEAMEVTVRLDYAGTITASYPEYHDGWHVRATPDGVLTDDSGRQYNCLFWEGVDDVSYDFRRGFCVAGEDTLAFLEEKLAVLGLSDREAGDFITYWLPRMQDNPYNLIAFQGRAYTDAARLTVEPEPDTMIRVFMAFRPLDEPVDVPEQELPSPLRAGFTVVEWGGTEIKD